MDPAQPERAQESYTKAQELRTFLFLSVFMAPILAVALVSGYGFLVWMFQLLAGPPGRHVISTLTRNVPEELHIAGLVVHSIPSRMQRVADTIAAIPGARVHGTSPGGKLVVTLEAGTADEMTSRMTSIQRADGVLAAALVYQCADSLEAMNEVLP